MSKLDDVLERLQEFKELHRIQTQLEERKGQFAGATSALMDCIAALEEAQEQFITLRRENRHLAEGIDARDQRVVEFKATIKMLNNTIRQRTERIAELEKQLATRTRDRIIQILDDFISTQ